MQESTGWLHQTFFVIFLINCNRNIVFVEPISDTIANH